jgi:hypothetical protein
VVTSKGTHTRLPILVARCREGIHKNRAHPSVRWKKHEALSLEDSRRKMCPFAESSGLASFAKPAPTMRKAPGGT